MTVPGYVDSDDLVWKRQWFDSTSAAARTFNVGQCVGMVRDTSSLNLKTATIHCLVTLRIHRNAGATLISNSRRTTPPSGALRWVGRVLVDGTKRPKPESRDGPAYFAVLTLF